MMGESVSDICAAGEMCNPPLSRCDDVPANPRRFGGAVQQREGRLVMSPR